MMSMRSARPALLGCGLALQLAAAGAGAWYGFDFGMRAGGVLVGTLAALNCAVMGGLLADGLIERVRQVAARRGR
jgi:hypothetical protein